MNAAPTPHLPSQILMLVGALLIGWHWFRLFSAAINTEALGAQFEKLLRANNLERAIKLSRAANHPVLQASRTVLEALDRGVSPAPADPADYRSAAVDRSPVAVLSTLRALYDARYAEATATWWMSRLASVLGALLVLAGAAVDVLRADPGWRPLAAAVGVAGFGYTLWRERQLRAEANVMFDRLAQTLYDTATQTRAAKL